MYRVHLAMNGFDLTTLVVIRTDCTGSCKSNYHQRWGQLHRKVINYICKVIVIQLITFQNPCNGNGNLIEDFGQVIVI
jgi:hypothetical protein